MFFIYICIKVYDMAKNNKMRTIQLVKGTNPGLFG